MFGTSSLSDVGCHSHPSCKHNILIVFHGITGLDRQMPLLELDK